MFTKIRVAKLLAALLFLLLLPQHLAAHKNHEEKKSEAVILAPGYEPLNFEAPTPGSYELPVIKHAPDAKVTTHHKQSTSIYELLEGQVGILSFIYTSCSDVNGCPLASFVLSKIDKRIQNDPLLKTSVKLLSVSFDHDTDTEDTLASYAKGFAAPDSTWAFLRAGSKLELQTLLKDYDQSIVVEPDGSTISHILRVYLIDLERNIRNVYSVSFLHADTVLSDIQTVLAQAAVNSVSVATGEALPRKMPKYGDYPTKSTALNYDSESSINLAIFSHKPQLGLPRRGGAKDVDKLEEIDLGKKLFFDRRLSHNDTISCAMCHIPEQGFTSNELSTAVGIEGRTVRRNTPSLYNVAYMERLFHDGRESKLEHQVWSPLLAHNEMANPSIGIVLEKLASIAGYQEAFNELYPQQGITMLTLGTAIAAYERALNAGDSPVDQLLFGDGSGQADPRLMSGLELFRGKAGCSICHSVGETSALFTDQQMHNTGIGYLRSMGSNQIFRKVLVAPGQTLEIHQDDVGPNELEAINDLGLYEITEKPADRWKYRTPSLRNVALTAPYMHNGSLAKLRDVVEFYNEGGIENPELDPLIKPLGLSEAEINQLVYFLEQLTSPHIEALVKDARATPIGERD